MINSLRDLFPVWLACVLLPLPAIAFWRSSDGRAVALWLFFIGCTSLVAYAFRQDIHAAVSPSAELPGRLWRKRLSVVTVSLLSACFVFSVLCLTLNDQHDFVVVFLAFLTLIPSLCVVPFLTLITRKPLAAVVFSLLLVGCMKLLGGAIVVLVFGWHASEHGHTDMPWTHPNLLVWVFWFNTSVLCLLLYRLGARRFRGIYDRAA
jgi:hypothetical protein